ncbi:MAG: ABC transporter ATP-binding protein [Phycisphaeraceae bacterium]|nr:ABC transporter ATP-binding protein [Phycisphaeraceae bacterium]
MLLAAKDVHKTYRMGRVDVPVLRGASLSVQKGECVAVLGASGSGKSTLLHLLGGLDRPDRQRGKGGDVVYGGQSLNELSGARLDRFRSETVGFVFQFYHLLPELNVVENVLVSAMVRWGRLGFRSRRSELVGEASALLDSFGLGHRLRHRPAELSGGERQRVAIARALINDPPLLLADEPTGNLDRATGRSILDSMDAHRARTGRTMVLVTHDAELAERADRVVHLHDGRVEAGRRQPTG